MERREFYKVVLSLSETYLDENLLKKGKLKLHHQRKNNDVTLCGLMLEREDKGPSPVLYLEEFFDEYKEGAEINNLMKKIASVYLKAWDESPQKDQFNFDFEKIRDNIIFKVVNASKNRKSLECLEHRNLGNDLAMIFAIRLGEDSVVNISKNLVNELNYDKEEIYSSAMKNTPKIFPAYFRGMLDYMGEKEFFGEGEIEGESESLYILTNIEKIYGAGVVFYPEILNMVSKKLGGDFYAIPSSVHEWLVFSEDVNNCQRDYHQMITEINENMVHRTEVLSDYLFKYDSNREEFFMLKDM